MEIYVSPYYGGLIEMYRMRESVHFSNNNVKWVPASKGNYPGLVREPQDGNNQSIGFGAPPQDAQLLYFI